jgi:hydrogenase maturation factor
VLKRKGVIIDKNIHETTIIVVDILNAEDILTYLFRVNVEDEFREIRDILKQNLRIKDKYCKADVSNKARNVYEMRFTKAGKNDRIYCQELHTNKKRFIIMCELFEGKKSQEIPKKIKSRLETIGAYEYEL